MKHRKLRTALALMTLAIAYTANASEQFQVRSYEYLTDLGRIEVEFKVNNPKIRVPAFFGVFIRDPVFGDIPLARGAARVCPNNVCRISLEENNQTRRYFADSPAVKSLFVVEVQDPESLIKYLESAKAGETEIKKVDKKTYRIFPILSYSSLSIKETPEVFFDGGTTQVAFNDSKFSRKLTFAPEFDLRLYSEYFYLRFKRYSVHFATRGFFSSVDEKPVDSRQTDSIVAMGLQGLSLLGVKPSLAVYYKNRNFETSVDDDYSIISTRTKSYGLEVSAPIPVKFGIFGFGEYFALKSDFIFISTYGSFYSPTEDYGPFKRGTEGTSFEAGADLIYFLKIGSKYLLLNNWLLGFGGAYEHSAVSFSGDFEVPPIYLGSPFNKDSRSKLSQFQIRFSLSREIQF